MPGVSKVSEESESDIAFYANYLKFLLTVRKYAVDITAFDTTPQLAQSRCSNVVSTFAERLDNVGIDVVSTFFCELVGTW